MSDRETEAGKAFNDSMGKTACIGVRGKAFTRKNVRFISEVPNGSFVTADLDYYKPHMPFQVSSIGRFEAFYLAPVYGETVQPKPDAVLTTAVGTAFRELLECGRVLSNEGKCIAPDAADASELPESLMVLRHNGKQVQILAIATRKIMKKMLPVPRNPAIRARVNLPIDSLFIGYLNKRDAGDTGITECILFGRIAINRGDRIDRQANQFVAIPGTECLCDLSCFTVPALPNAPPLTVGDVAMADGEEEQASPHPLPTQTSATIKITRSSPVSVW